MTFAARPGVSMTEDPACGTMLETTWGPSMHEMEGPHRVERRHSARAT
jgi:hypothetical protein